MGFLEEHVYLLLLTLSVVEGPVVSFVSSGIAAQGSLRMDFVIWIMLLGDIIGDILFYGLGFFFSKIGILQKFSYISKKTEQFHAGIQKNPLKYLLLVKMTPYLAMPSLLFLGHKKYKFRLFIIYSVISSMAVKSVYLIVGYYGSVSLQELTRFLSGWKQVVLFLIFGTIIFFGVKKLYLYIGNYIKKNSK